jgi:uncharacterized iron-regulated protein
MKLFALFSILGCLFTSVSSAAVWDGRILRVKDGVVLGLPDLADQMAGIQNVILGEKHDTAAIQRAQSLTIGAVASRSAPAYVTTAWEFLDYPDQPLNQDAFSKFASGSITATEFLTLTQGKPKYLNYAPILEVTKNLGGHLMGVNLPRKMKDPVVQGGLDAAIPGTIPAQFELGSEAYLARFRLAMEGHATNEQINNYFAAQSLTDEVMAEQLLMNSDAPLKFLVVGSFHTDYHDGVVARIMKRAPDQTIRVIRYIDASDYTDAELQKLHHDEQYGDLSDYLYFVNEPQS